MATEHHLNLRLWPQDFSICRLAPGDPVPNWAGGASGFLSVTRTPAELTVVCSKAVVPPEVRQEGGWGLLEVEGPLDFALTGILASLAGPLARAGVSIFALSTFDTDYVMVRRQQMEQGIQALESAGHRVLRL
jgi:uncharacterized protein